MIRGLTTAVSALLVLAPLSLRAEQTKIQTDHPALRLMNTSQFSLFLKRLDADVVGWRARLATIDVASLGAEPQEREEIERSYTFCLRGLENTRAEIQKLSQKQTLKFDFLLLVDLNELVRNLDRLDADLINLHTVQETNAVKRSLGWAREVLRIDAALGAHISELQRHVLALAGLMDAALAQAEQGSDEAQNRK